ncbi:MAG: hypothetical protein DMD69_13980 [Gemmatimonadetes bacterium]|nr:MAG: hypothetical protein DMD69_13980 [Gemmatimonadota bacterium]PYP27680.1 MAG: hypothetical protein DMD55_07950 [Gemmatimonadota bacterium]
MRTLALGYHDVVDGGAWDTSGFPGPTHATYKLDRRAFEQHLVAVSGAARRRGTVRDLLYTRTPASHQPPVLLTFDDGGASAYSCIADLLERAGWRGHFFIITDYLDRPGFVTTPQVRELAARGHVIGTHSCSHPTRMASCSWDRLIQEWTTSAAILSELLGEPVRIASVPGGAYSSRVAEAAAVAGITALFTSEPTSRCHQVDGCLVVGRYSLRRGTPARIAAALASGRLLPRLAQLCFWNCKKLAKAVGGERYLALRRMVYGAASTQVDRTASRGLPDCGPRTQEGQQPGVQRSHVAGEQVRRQGE